MIDQITPRSSWVNRPCPDRICPYLNGPKVFQRSRKIGMLVCSYLDRRASRFSRGEPNHIMINGIRRNGPNERTNEQTNKQGGSSACVCIFTRWSEQRLVKKRDNRLCTAWRCHYIQRRGSTQKWDTAISKASAFARRVLKRGNGIKRRGLGFSSSTRRYSFSPRFYDEIMANACNYSLCFAE